VEDTFAYVAPDIQIINVADPSHPSPVSTTPCNCWDIALSDTFAFIAHAYESLKVYTVANPYAPSRLASVWVPGQAFAVALRDSLAYLGCNDLRVFSIINPTSPILAGRYPTPYLARGVDFDDQYIYVASSMAGVEMLELFPAGVSEPGGESLGLTQGMARVLPSPVRRWCRLSFSPAVGVREVQVHDVLGRVVARVAITARAADTPVVDFGQLKPGVYLLRVAPGRLLGRFVKI
jgi:hypothetical protein